MFVLLRWVRRFQQFDLAVEHKFRGLDIKQAPSNSRRSHCGVNPGKTVNEFVIRQFLGFARYFIFLSFNSGRTANASMRSLFE